MPYSYNQLIKECLQKTQNIDLTPIENAISAMQEDLTTLQTLLNSLSKDSNGNYIISIPTKFLDNVTVEGTQTIVKTQEIQSENDYIILREGNPLGLAAGAYSGFKIKNYDGNSNNCLLVVDKDGWARIGDENGTVQKIATIEENPTNGALVAYNTTTKQLESQNVSISNFVKKFDDSEGAALAVDEIGQYQGVTTAKLTNGYFYKNIILHNIGDYYLQVETNHSISLYDGTITPDFYTLDIGDYYNDSGATPSVNSMIQNGVYKYSGTNYNVIFVSNDPIHWSDVAVGDWILFNNANDNIGASNIFEWVNIGNFYLAQITNITRDGFGSISEFQIGTSTFTFVSGYGRINTSGDSIPVNINGVQTTVLYNANLNAALILAPMSNGKLAPILIFETIAEVDTPITGLVQTDTQPQPTNGSDMIVNFTPDTSAVRANIQSGDTIAQMAKIVNSNFGFSYVNNSSFEFTSYVTSSNLYGVFFSGLGVLVLNGWFRIVTTDIPRHTNIFRFKGYTPLSGYPKFMDENSNNIITLRTGESGKEEWWIFNYRSSTDDLYWEGLPTIVVVVKTV